MLIITRRPGESFFIGDNITITVLQSSAKNVSIGIDAPRDVQILRDDAKNYQPKPVAAG